MKIPRSTLKMSFFDVYASFLKETHVCTRLSLYNTHARFKYVTLWIETHVYLIVYMTVISTTRICLLKMSKKYGF